MGFTFLCMVKYFFSETFRTLMYNRHFLYFFPAWYIACKTRGPIWRSLQLFMSSLTSIFCVCICANETWQCHFYCWLLECSFILICKSSILPNVLNYFKCIVQHYTIRLRNTTAHPAHPLEQFLLGLKVTQRKYLCQE